MIGPAHHRTGPTLLGVPAELEPPELADLVDYAERSRVGDWSLRSALVRYAQGQPVRVSQVLELVRRIDAAIHPHTKLLSTEGSRLWSALADDGKPPTEPTAHVVELLRAMTVLDGLAHELAAWADDRTRPRPDAAVDTAVADVTRQLDELGVPREEPQQRPRRRG